MTEKILLVEDDPMIGEAVVQALRDAGKASDWARSGWEATGFLSENGYDAVLLDLGLPGKDGMSVLRELRAKDGETPVIILTARDGLDDRLAGLDAGADDYVVKPFHMSEVLARLRAIERRRAGARTTVKVLTNGAMSLNCETKSIKLHAPEGDKEVPLSDAEQAIRLVRQHASEWGVNPHRVGIMGASAGGHLAASLATLYSTEETRPDFQILFYPVISMKPGITHQGSHDNLLGKEPDKELEDHYSLEKQVTAQTPQAFLMLSGDDTVVIPQNSIDYFMALRKYGVSASLHIYPTGGHGWGFGDGFPYKSQWTGELEKWLGELKFEY